MNSIREILTVINIEGLAIGLATFLIIGIFHPLVIKGEYYLGQKANWLFLIAGLGMLAASLSTTGVWSIICGVPGFSCFGAFRVGREPGERVRNGGSPANPRRQPSDSPKQGQSN